MPTLTACPIPSSSLVARTSLGLQHRFSSSLPGDEALHAPTGKVRRKFAPFKMAHSAPFETLGIYGRVCKHAGPGPQGLPFLIHAPSDTGTFACCNLLVRSGTLREARQTLLHLVHASGLQLAISGMPASPVTLLHAEGGKAASEAASSLYELICVALAGGLRMPHQDHQAPV